MTTPSTKRERKNTYKLPAGEPLRRELVKFFAEQRNAILRFVRTGKVEAKELQSMPSGFPAWDEFKLGTLAMAERMTPMITATWDEAGSKFASKVGLDPDQWSVVNPETASEIEKSVLAFAKSTNDTTSMELSDALDAVRKTLHEGIVDQGETIAQLTKRINDIFDTATKSRARRIAQTETARAVHSAQESAGLKSGVVTGWQWLASSDACEICLAIAARAKFVRIGQPFAIIGDSPTYQTIKFPPAHPHCRCSMVPVLDTDPQPDFKDTLNQPEGATDEEAAKLQAELEASYNEILAGSVAYGAAPRTFTQPATPAKPGKPKKPAAPKTPKAKRPKLPPTPYEPAEVPGVPLRPGAERIPPVAQPPAPPTAGNLKTIEQVQSWLKTTFPNATIHADGIPPEMWNSMSQELGSLAKDYPGVANKLKHVGTNDPMWKKGKNARAIARADNDNGEFLNFNPVYWGKPETISSEVKSSSSTGWFVKGVSDPGYVVAHEWGHLVDAHLKATDKKKWIDVRKVFADDPAKLDWNKAKNVSKYATTNRLEAIAESFAALRHQPGNMQSEVVKEFGRTLNK